MRYQCAEEIVPYCVVARPHTASCIAVVVIRYDGWMLIRLSVFRREEALLIISAT